MCQYFFFQAEDGIRDKLVTGVQTCALPISAFLCSSTLPVMKGSSSGPISRRTSVRYDARTVPSSVRPRSEEHTSELQSLAYLVCRLLLEKKKNILSTSLYSRHRLFDPVVTIQA